MATERFLDLHCHTTFSDGSFSPEEVVAQAADAGVGTLAISDHDDVQQWPHASAAAAARDVQLISGVELTTEHGGREVHILGYGFDPEDEALSGYLQWFKDERRERAGKMIRKLQELGLEIELEDVVPPDFSGALARPHLARHLHKTGQVATVQQAFDLYLANGRPAALAKAYLDPARSCEVIREAGGIPVIAHPGLCNGHEFLHELADMGLGGVEVMHPQHSGSQREQYAALAERFGLVKTGGSDFHGAAKPDVHFGDVQTPAAWAEPLQAAIAQAQDEAGVAPRST